MSLEMIAGRRLVRMAATGLSLLMATSLLGGCGSITSALGLERSSPDEFAVVPRAPLEQPPDFNLRPPAPGSPRPQELERERRSSTSVFGASQSAPGVLGQGPLRGNPATQVSRQSAGEILVLQQAGAEQADPDIRAIVDREQPGVVVGDRDFLDRLMFWKGEETAAPAAASAAAATPAPAPAAAPAPTAKPAEAPAAKPEEERSFWDRLKFWKKDEEKPAN